MGFLYEVKGSGSLRARGEDLGTVRYRISVFQQPTIKKVQGTLWADWAVLEAALDAGDAVLTRENGQDLQVVVRSVGRDSAPIAVNTIPKPQGPGHNT